MGVFEKDLAASTLLAVPELYNIGQQNRGFNFGRYVMWATAGACEAVVVYFMVYGIFGEAIFARDQTLYAMGVLAYTACVTIISIKLQFIELHNKSVTAAIAIVLSVGGWWLWNLLLSVLYPDDKIYSVRRGLLERFGRDGLWGLTLIAVVLAVCVLEIGVKTVKATVLPSDVDVFQELERDAEVRTRFEGAAASLLQHSSGRGTKDSSPASYLEKTDQEEREAQMQDLLNKRRTTDAHQNWTRRRPSAPSRSSSAVKTATIHHTEEPQEMGEVPRRSVDVGELFSKGFGAVRKGPELR
jgi:phospholipid-translocating ATPase